MAQFEIYDSISYIPFSFPSNVPVTAGNVHLEVDSDDVGPDLSYHHIGMAGD